MAQSTSMEISGYKKCKDCLAHYPKTNRHECFGFMKFLVDLNRRKRGDSSGNDGNEVELKEVEKKED